MLGAKPPLDQSSLITNYMLMPIYFENGFSVFIQGGIMYSIIDRFEVNDLFACDVDVGSQYQSNDIDGKRVIG